MTGKSEDTERKEKADQNGKSEQAGNAEMAVNTSSGKIRTTENISNSVDTYSTSILIEGCTSLGIALSDAQVDQLVRFYRMLIEKNKVMNLTAVTEWEAVQTRHFLDSLLLCGCMDLDRSLNVLDLGTGAGFPGIVLKIAFPQIRIVLADSLNKRILFLNDVIRELGLREIETVHGRAEDLGKNKEFREQFDLTVSRAVANLSSLSEYCIPFVKQGGHFVSYKSADITKELQEAENAIRILGGGRPEVRQLSLPGTDLKRSFVIVTKERKTPSRYPRKAGTPSRDPLH